VRGHGRRAEVEQLDLGFNVTSVHE